MTPLPRRSKSRITKDGILLDRRIAALRRIQALTPEPDKHNPTSAEIKEASSRWEALKHSIFRN